MDFLANLDTLQKTLAAVATVAGVVFAFWKWVRPRWRSLKSDFRAGRDALVGREAVVDSITGKELAPALPGMGVRMDTNERQLATLTEAVVALANTTTRLDDIERRVGVNERRLDRLEAPLRQPAVVVQQNLHAQDALLPWPETDEDGRGSE